MSDWRTIDSAPKDGSYFLSWNGEAMAVISWSGEAWQLAIGSVDLDYEDEPAGPTHWVALPSPPEDSQ